MEQRDEQRDLQHDRQTTEQRVAVLLLQRHDLGVHLLLVVPVLVSDFLDLGLHQLHRPLRLHLLDEQRKDQNTDTDHQQDDRKRPREEAVLTEDRPETTMEDDDRVCREMVEGIQHWPVSLDPRATADPRATTGRGRLVRVLGGVTHNGVTRRNRVIPSGRQRLAAQQPAGAQQAAPDPPVTAHRLKPIGAAGRLEAADARAAHRPGGPVKSDHGTQRPREGTAHHAAGATTQPRRDPCGDTTCHSQIEHCK